MNEKEIREHFAAHPVENQVEFEAWMAEINATQFGLVESYDTRLRDITKRRSNIVAQKSALNIQLDMLKQERATVEDERRQIYAVFHELKHAMIQFNPREKFIKEQDADPRPYTEEAYLEVLEAKRDSALEDIGDFFDEHIVEMCRNISKERFQAFINSWDRYKSLRYEIRRIRESLSCNENNQPKD